MSTNDCSNGKPKGSSIQGDQRVPLPRTKRKRRRTREERGLPKPKALKSLVQTYLESQHRLWPKLVGTELPAKITTEVIDDLASQFRTIFLGGELPVFQTKARKPQWDAIASAYVRYSCDHSNPRSLDQQLKLALEKAKQDDYFIPWQYVFADAAVSGTTAERTGYQFVKGAMSNEDHRIEAMFIDEIGRASRDMVEALSLGRLLEYHNKLLMGVSDGFDMRTPMWKPMLSIFGALQEWFIDQLRTKVNRGLNDAFDQGQIISIPGIGYKRVPRVDKEGKPVFKENGVRKSTVVIDETTSKFVLLAFRLYAERNRSPDEIAKFFNRREVDGRRTWDGSRIRGLLSRHRFVGILIKGRTQVEKHPVTAKKKTVNRPRDKWRVKRIRRLQFVPWTLWKKTRQRMKDCSRAYDNTDRSRNRSDVYPTTLIRPVCGSCGQPLWKGRSGKYTSFVCINGRDRKNGCKFRGYKSAKIVEESILEYLKSKILTEDAVDNLVKKANEYLRAEAAKPAVDLNPLRLQIRKIKKTIDRLNDAIEESESDIPSLIKRLDAREKELTALNIELRQGEGDQRDVPVPLRTQEVRALVSDLRWLLQSDIAQAAPLIRKLTGPVTIHQVKEKGKKKPKWIAKFDAELMPAMLELSRKKNCPTTGNWEYLCTRSWTKGISGEVWCRDVPNYERIAPEATEMSEKGASIETIGRATETSWETVKDALNFARTGKRPGTKRTGNKTRKRSGPPKHQRISAEVVSRRELGHSFARISRELGEPVGTVTRAYDFGNREKLESAAARGETPNRGRYRHIPAETIDKVHLLLSTGKMTPAEIAKFTGVGESTVRRESKKLSLNINAA